MRMVDKKLLDELIELYRQHIGADNKEACVEYHRRCQDKAMELEKKCGMFWGNSTNLLWSILCPYGLQPNATNKKIYRILKELGWEVKENG